MWKDIHSWTTVWHDRHWMHPKSGLRMPHILHSALTVFDFACNCQHVERIVIKDTAISVATACSFLVLFFEFVTSSWRFRLMFSEEWMSSRCNPDSNLDLCSSTPDFRIWANPRSRNYIATLETFHVESIAILLRCVTNNGSIRPSRRALERTLWPFESFLYQINTQQCIKRIKHTSSVPRFPSLWFGIARLPSKCKIVERLPLVNDVVTSSQRKSRNKISY